MNRRNASKNTVGISGKMACGNGISFRSDIGFSLEKDPGRGFYPLVQFAVTVISSLAAVFMLISFLSSELGYISPTPLIVSVFATAFAVLLVSRGGRFLKISGAAFLILETVYVMFQLKTAVNGLLYTAYAYTVKAKLSIPAFSQMITASSKYDAQIFFLTLAFLITLGISLGCIYYTNFPILFLCTFPIFEMGAFWGWEPAAWTFPAMVTCWIVILSLNLINHTTKKRGSTNTFAVYKRKKTFYLTSEGVKKRFFGFAASMAAVVCAAVFIIAASASMIMDSYRSQQTDELRVKLSNDFQDFTNRLSNKVNLSPNDFPGRGKMIGGTNGGRLGLYDKITFSGNTALNVYCDKLDEPMYLRGYTGTDYTSNCWNPIELNDDIQQNFTADGDTALDYGWLRSSEITPVSSIEIKALNANKEVIYAPYNADYTDCDNVKGQKYEGMISPKKGSEKYKLSYAEGDASGEKFADLADEHSDYNEYALYSSDFGSVPDDLKPLLDEILQERTDTDLYSTAQYISDYFNENSFKYTLAPGITPSGEDFISYFLTEQKKGYCTYFASAGVMLMREAGFSARYVEGYVIEPAQQSDANERIRVSDRCAHAWCEVYIDGAGWYPLEFTPGFENDNPNLTMDERVAEKSDSSESGNSSAAKTESMSFSKSESSSKRDTSSAGKNSKPSASSKSGIADTSNASGDGNVADTSLTGSGTASGGSGGAGVKINPATVGYVGGTVIFFLILAAAATIRRKHGLEKMDREINFEDNSAAVIACYKYYLAYLALAGIESRENSTDSQTAEKLEKTLRERFPQLCDGFMQLSELAIKAYMSAEKANDSDANTARVLLSQAAQAVYSQLGTFEKAAAKWGRNLY